MKTPITITVNLETIESGNNELLMCEAKDYLDKSTYKTNTTEPSIKIEYIDKDEWNRRLND